MSHAFTQACNGCSACFRQCPNDAIYGTFQERYDVDPLLCIDCGVCGMICPRGAVLDQTGQTALRVPRVQRLRPVFDPALCNGCGLCGEFCRFGCLSFVGERYQGVAYLSEPMACVSCGECANICIKGAVEMRPYDLKEHDPETVADALLELVGS